MGRVLQRTARLLGVVFALSTVVFFLQRSIPGSPADAILGQDAPETAKRAWLTSQGFDRPLDQQYAAFLGDLLRGNLGTSFSGRKQVTALVLPRLWATLILTLSAFAVAVGAALTMGLLSARFAGGWWDQSFTICSVVIASIPTFVLGPVLLWVFSVELGLFPLGGMVGPSSVVLPALTLGIALSALTGRLLRAGLLETLEEDFIRTARSKGLSETQILLRHAFPNAAIPVVTVLALDAGALVSGALVTETIFARPGMGKLIYDSIMGNDYNLALLALLLAALVTMLATLAADVAQRLLDPRLAR